MHDTSMLTRDAMLIRRKHAPTWARGEREARRRQWAIQSGFIEGRKVARTQSRRARVTPCVEAPRGPISYAPTLCYDGEAMWSTPLDWCNAQALRRGEHVTHLTQFELRERNRPHVEALASAGHVWAKRLLALSL